jgi:hypothetical protein
MQGKDARDMGVAFFVGLVSAILPRTVAAGRVVLGETNPIGIVYLFPQRIIR